MNQGQGSVDSYLSLRLGTDDIVAKIGKMQILNGVRRETILVNMFRV